jgi:hypothetical protein
MSDDSKKDPIEEIQKRVTKDLRENEAVAAALASFNERAAESLSRALDAHTPKFENLGKALAVRLLEQHEQKVAEEERLQAAIRWIEDKWGDQACPYCEQVEWQVGTPAEISLSAGEVMSPTFPVMCGNCGHTTFVNAIKAGLLSEPEGEE